jgi:cytidylate kinase
MNRIVIIGPPGAGKTDFANELGKILDIDTVIHLDYFFWKPGWIRTTETERHALITRLTKQEKWIIEGNFLDTIDAQFSQASLAIWLNLNPFLCFYRVVKRYFSYIRKGIPEIAPGCRDRIRLQFLLSIFMYKIIDSNILRKKLKQQSSLPLIVLNTPNEVLAFLEKINLNPRQGYDQLKGFS